MDEKERRELARLDNQIDRLFEAEDRPLLKTVEVARLLGVTPGRVRQMYAEGRIETVRIGKLYFVRREAWERFIRGDEVPALKGA